LPDVGTVSPIELYEASVSEQRVREEIGPPRIPIERHPDGHRFDPDDGKDPMFGRRQIDKRSGKDLTVPRPLPYAPSFPIPGPPSHTVDVDFGYNGGRKTYSIPKEIQEEELNAFASNELGHRIATPDYTGHHPQTDSDSCQAHSNHAHLSGFRSVRHRSKGLRSLGSNYRVQKQILRILDPNEIYWMTPKTAGPDGAPEPLVEPELTGLASIPPV
jgi:hypothetical protein